MVGGLILNFETIIKILNNEIGDRFETITFDLGFITILLSNIMKAKIKKFFILLVITGY